MNTPQNESWSVVSDAQQLRELVGSPIQRVADKARPTLHELDRQWLAASPLCLVATAAADGSCDVSPRGDPPGFTHVLDERTIAIPERPGNRRADGFCNLLENPHVGLIFLIPGRGDTLRINGTAELLRDAPFFDEMVVNEHRPRLALLVHVQEVFHHCSKAFLRSSLWDPSSWAPDAIASRARIARTLEQPDRPLEELEHYYGPGYADRLYR
ncbi:MAG: pyridoxamine 5'-phosphate oxidase [Solirubrobacterales bacterium]|nr:MAG: pyridoxamine 5'-phosphate oxidase [Solirubrobacterales bacterium]PZS10016.1 MAG: pyridoxamine 5'-phosphate oxidase [Solirubrobacterales bacterium]